MSKKEGSTRRAGKFPGKQRSGRNGANEQGGIRNADDNRSTKTAQRATYTQAEADRRRREAMQRIARQRQRQQAARYFRRLEVVRRV